MSSTIVTVNPATGAELATYQAMTQAEIDSALDAAAAAQRGWAGEDFTVARRGPAHRRGHCCASATTSWRCWSPARWASRWPKPGPRCTSARPGWSSTPSTRPTFLADEIYETAADRSWVSYEPVGVVLAVMPWNFPLWQVFRFAAPALMAGNAALLKHSPNTTGAALACQDILTAAGLPDGLVHRAAWSPNRDVPAITERLIADPRVGAVTITGSERAGSAVGVHRRPGDQEVGAGTRRVGPVRRAGRRRPAPGRRSGRQRPVPQRRAELHLPQALHRRSLGRRGVHAPGRRATPSR